MDLDEDVEFLVGIEVRMVSAPLTCKSNCCMRWLSVVFPSNSYFDRGAPVS